MAEPYKVGDSFAGFKAPDQHGVLYKFKPGEVKYVLFDTPTGEDKATTPEDPNWFAEHQAILIVNISDFSFIKRDLARSRLESKKYAALVLSDKAAAERFPTEAGKISVLTLDKKGRITAIRFGAPGKEVQALLTDKK